VVGDGELTVLDQALERFVEKPHAGKNSRLSPPRNGAKLAP
jgi:hypothetical protein